MKKISLLILFLILVLAFILRFYKITLVPPSLNWDEASIGYNAYSVLQTGHDEWGEFLPLHFKSYGEYKLPGQVYASIPAIYIFGLTPFGVRVTPLVYGVLTVLFLYFLTKSLYKKEGVALITAFFLAVSPWHIQLTRASFESSFALMWVILGVWFFVKGFKNTKWWFISMIPFAIAVYTYNSARFFVPLFLITNFIIYRKDLLASKKTAILSAFLFALLMIPLALFMVSGGGEARYKLVSVTDEAGLVPRIEEARNLSGLPTPVKELVHNRPVYVSYYLIRNYLAHFTPNFLFLKGASHAQHHVGGIGELYLIQLPFLLYGIYITYKKKNKFFWLLISWGLLAILPAALTRDSIPHALRTLNSVPVYQIFTGVGMYYLYMLFRRRSRMQAVMYVLFISVLFSAQFVTYLNNYFNAYPEKYSRDWQYGYEEAFSYIKDHYNDYDLIVVTREYGEPHMFALFFLNYPPETYYNNPNLERFETYDWVRVLRFDKFFFPDLGDEGTKMGDIIQNNPGKKILFVGTPEEIPKNSNILKEIKFLNGTPAFEITDGI